MAETAIDDRWVPGAAEQGDHRRRPSQGQVELALPQTTALRCLQTDVLRDR